jgi:hypothetical protein
MSRRREAGAPDDYEEKRAAGETQPDVQGMGAFAVEGGAEIAPQRGGAQEPPRAGKDGE